MQEEEEEEVAAAVNLVTIPPTLTQLTGQCKHEALRRVVPCTGVLQRRAASAGTEALKQRPVGSGFAAAEVGQLMRCRGGDH